MTIFSLYKCTLWICYSLQHIYNFIWKHLEIWETSFLETKISILHTFLFSFVILLILCWKCSKRKILKVVIKGLLNNGKIDSWNWQLKIIMKYITIFNFLFVLCKKKPVYFFIAIWTSMTCTPNKLCFENTWIPCYN